MPTKNFELPGAMPCTLKRAKRHAQQIKNARQKSSPIGRAVDVDGSGGETLPETQA